MRWMHVPRLTDYLGLQGKELKQQTLNCLLPGFSLNRKGTHLHREENIMHRSRGWGRAQPGPCSDTHRAGRQRDTTVEHRGD